MPGGYVCSGSDEGGGRTRPTCASTVAGERAGAEALLARSSASSSPRTRRRGSALDDLSILGPIFVLKLRFTPEELGRRLVAEMWLYPDGSRLLELSTRCAPTEAFEIAAELRAFLADRGVDLSGEQQTKTRKALEYFARGLREGRAPAAQ